jgi:S-phase kinase-associated protein 1
MAEASTAMVTLVSQEGNKLEVKASVIKKSELCVTMLDDADDDDDTAQEIPLPNVKDETLKKVIEFLEYHSENEFKEIEKPLKSADMKEVVSEWDAEFVSVENEKLFELILAANYMDVKDLLDLTCAKVGESCADFPVACFYSRYSPLPCSNRHLIREGRPPIPSSYLLPG